jgi:hypothetical protein
MGVQESYRDDDIIGSHLLPYIPSELLFFVQLFTHFNFSTILRLTTAALFNNHLPLAYASLTRLVKAEVTQHELFPYNDFRAFFFKIEQSGPNLELNGQNHPNLIQHRLNTQNSKLNPNIKRNLALNSVLLHYILSYIDIMHTIVCKPAAGFLTTSALETETSITTIHDEKITNYADQTSNNILSSVNLYEVELPPSLSNVPPQFLQLIELCQGNQALFDMAMDQLGLERGSLNLDISKQHFIRVVPGGFSQYFTQKYYNSPLYNHHLHRTHPYPDEFIIPMYSVYFKLLGDVILLFSSISNHFDFFDPKRFHNESMKRMYRKSGQTRFPQVVDFGIGVAKNGNENNQLNRNTRLKFGNVKLLDEPNNDFEYTDQISPNNNITHPNNSQASRNTQDNPIDFAVANLRAQLRRELYGDEGIVHNHALGNDAQNVDRNLSNLRNLAPREDNCVFLANCTEADFVSYGYILPDDNVHYTPHSIVEHVARTGIGKTIGSKLFEERKQLFENQHQVKLVNNFPKHEKTEPTIPFETTFYRPKDPHWEDLPTFLQDPYHISTMKNNYNPDFRYFENPTKLTKQKTDSKTTKNEQSETHNIPHKSAILHHPPEYNNPAVPIALDLQSLMIQHCIELFIEAIIVDENFEKIKNINFNFINFQNQFNSQTKKLFQSHSHNYNHQHTKLCFDSKVNTISTVCTPETTIATPIEEESCETLLTPNNHPSSVPPENTNESLLKSLKELHNPHSNDYFIVLDEDNFVIRKG